MNARNPKTWLIALAGCVSTLGTASPHDASTVSTATRPIRMFVAQAPADEDQAAHAPTLDRAVALTQLLATNEAQLRSYQWIETTFISQISQVRSYTLKQCYYDADGRLQKVLLSRPGYFELPGLTPLGKLANKAVPPVEEKVPPYMKSAADLLHAYVPLDATRIQQSVNAGKFSLSVLRPERLVRLAFRDYLKPGDVLSVDTELGTGRPVGMNVFSYLGTVADVVTLSVTMGMLPGGTFYPARSILDVKAKGIRVDVENSSHARAE